MPSKSFIRKQIAGHSASRGGSSRDLESKVTNNLYISSARAKQLSEEHILKNAINKNTSDINSNQNEFQSNNEMLNQHIDLETLVISIKMFFFSSSYILTFIYRPIQFI